MMKNKQSSRMMYHAGDSVLGGAYAVGDEVDDG